MGRLKTTTEILKGAVAALVAGGLFLAAEPASALPIMILSDGTTTITVEDNDPLYDSFGGIDGVIKFAGTIGNFYINVTTGISKPVLGSAAWPKMDLNDMSVTSSSGGGTLTITFSDSGFEGPAVLSSAVGGETDGAVRFEVWMDPSNNLLAKTTQIADLGSFAGGSFNGTTSGAFTTGAGLYSITQVAILTHSAGNSSSSFNLKTKAVPEPATLGLLGVGLAALGFNVRRRRNAA